MRITSSVKDKCVIYPMTYIWAETYNDHACSPAILRHPDMHSILRINKRGEMGSPCLTPHLPSKKTTKTTIHKNGLLCSGCKFRDPRL